MRRAAVSTSESGGGGGLADDLAGWRRARRGRASAPRRQPQALRCSINTVQQPARSARPPAHSPRPACAQHPPAARPRGWRPWTAGAQRAWRCCAACWSPGCREGGHGEGTHGRHVSARRPARAHARGWRRTGTPLQQAAHRQATAAGGAARVTAPCSRLPALPCTPSTTHRWMSWYRRTHASAQNPRPIQEPAQRPGPLRQPTHRWMSWYWRTKASAKQSAYSRFTLAKRSAISA